MVKQIQIGIDELSFLKQDDNGINCKPCFTPTPTPTVACVTVNLKANISCDEYIIKDSSKPISVDKAMDVVKTDDNEMVLAGYGSCLLLNDTLPISRGLIGKTLLKTIKEEENKTSTQFVMDNDFGTKGMVNNIFYNSNNLRVPSKFDHIVTQTVSGQTKLIVAGQTDYKGLVARYSANGSLDRTFGLSTGYVTLDTLGDGQLSSIKILDIFGIHIQTDNKILLFCNGYDLINKRSICVIIRLRNSGIIDESFNNNQGFLQIRSTKPDFDGSRFIGKDIYYAKTSNYLLLAFESFSSITQNTVILTKYDLSTNSLATNFGEEANDVYVYANIDKKNTYLQNIFVRQNSDKKDIICLVLNNKTSLQINKYTDDGKKIYIDDEKGKKVEEPPILIKNDIFTISDKDGSGALEVSFENIRCNHIDLESKGVVLFANVTIKNNPINLLGGPNPSLFHWLEKQSLVQGSFDYSGLEYRDCTTLLCDRQPEDSYGTLVVKSQALLKSDTKSRILFGSLQLSSDLSTVSPIKLDRFYELVENNIIKKVIEISTGVYVGVGYYGSVTQSSLVMKNLSFTPNDKSLGPDKNDILGIIDFSDFCNSVAVTDNIVVEECPCAPPPTPTPSPTSPPTLVDIYIDTISDACDNALPIIRAKWKKNKAQLSGSYVLQIVRSSDKKELVAGSFLVDSDASEGFADISVASLDKAVDNQKTCTAILLDSSGGLVFSKVFVLNIRNCI